MGDTTRRHFFEAACALGAAGVTAGTAEADTRAFTPLGRDDTITLSQSPESLINRAYELGRTYQGTHSGCSRCSVAALQDTLDFVPNDVGLFRGAGCLDGGATPTKRASCGAFTGCGMIIGYMTAPDDFGDKTFAREIINELHARFVELWGGVLCGEVRPAAEKKCDEVVGLACKWTAEIMLEKIGTEG